VAITPSTRKEDDKLRKMLKNADLKKFDKAIRAVFGPRKKVKKK
jgi:hypothetical protein